MQSNVVEKNVPKNISNNKKKGQKNSNKPSQKGHARPTEEEPFQKTGKDQQNSVHTTAKTPPVNMQPHVAKKTSPTNTRKNKTQGRKNSNKPSQKGKQMQAKPAKKHTRIKQTIPKQHLASFFLERTAHSQPFFSNRSGK